MVNYSSLTIYLKLRKKHNVKYKPFDLYINRSLYDIYTDAYAVCM